LPKQTRAWRSRIRTNPAPWYQSSAATGSRRGKARTAVSRGEKAISRSRMGFGYCRKIKSGWLFVERAGDHQVLTYCEIVALGIPGAAAFKAEMTPALLPFTDIAIVQEPEKAGEQFVAASRWR